MDNENDSWLLIGSTNQNTLFCQSPINKTSTTHIDIPDIDVIGCHYSWRLVSFILLCVSDDNRFMLFKIDSDLDSKTAFPVLYRTWYSDWSPVSANQIKSSLFYSLEFQTSQDEFVISSSQSKCIILALDNENLKTASLPKLPFMPSIFPTKDNQFHVIQSNDWTKLEKIDYPMMTASDQNSTTSGRDSGEDRIEELFQKLAGLKEISKNLQGELKIENDFFKILSDLSQRSFRNEMPLSLEISITTFDSYSNIWSVHLHSSTSGGTSGLDPFGYRLKFRLKGEKNSKIKFFTEPKFMIPKNLDLVWSEVIFGTCQKSSISIPVQFRILA